MRARRALLYVPGNERHKIEKAATLSADSVCLDLEDGVAVNRKVEARETVADALRSLEFGKSERLARINIVGSGLEADDLAAVLPARPNGIVMPKVTNAREVHWVSDQIGIAERSMRLEPGSIRLLLMIENAQGIVNLPLIASADRRVDALIFGSEDFAADIGAVRTREGWEVFYARSAVITYAAAYDLQAIDLLDTDFKDIERLREESLQGARMGFGGKQIIHPNQITPVQEAFTPSDNEIAHAQRVIQAAAEAQVIGNGAFALDGKMIDRPIIKAAERIITRARAANKIS
ncbi:MAG: CoA ester lyase [Anaerolineae bacterium]